MVGTPTRSRNFYSPKFTRILGTRFGIYDKFVASKGMAWYFYWRLRTRKADMDIWDVIEDCKINKLPVEFASHCHNIATTNKYCVNFLSAGPRSTGEVNEIWSEHQTSKMSHITMLFKYLRNFESRGQPYGNGMRLPAVAQQKNVNLRASSKDLTTQVVCQFRM